ncbi:Histone-lysine N-methyltransferase setd3 [Schistosoma japonicum]|uniref:protein-histidine N-methyltransferase n=2 Tax=Schistosoma japonicum TaxID=6182 RepID=A0A4Z2DMZ5_SCHJA|nr:Histone-lysine N-methyltransferase setd3 [Schistosoma japonicum]
MFEMSKPNMSFCQVRDKSAELASRLMERCLNSTITLNNAIDVLEVLQALTSEIISVQTGYSYISKLTKSRENRKTTLESFLYSDKYTVHWFEEYGFGLRALVPIEEGYKLIRLPRRSVFCLENSSTILKEFIAQDTLASNMENIALCLCLLGELYQGDESAWQDYIKTLPSDYPTFLYMNAADIRLMKGSPVIEKIAFNYLLICRHYAYFYCRFLKGPKVLNIPNFIFCFDDYKWAVSTVMSRSNYIPHFNGRDKIICLIPVWDMINHKSSHVTTHYDLEADELIFSTMEAYKPGDQIFMDYGKRSNEDFFMFSGFVPKVNPDNKLTITLGISSSDSLASTRKQLLQTLNLNVPLKCDLRGNIESMTEFFIFSRVFSMDKDELNKHLLDVELNCEMVKSKLSNFKFQTEIASECQAFSFMVNRLKLLIAAYRTVLSEDNPQWNQLTSIQQNCERLKYYEIVILHSSIKNIQSIMDTSCKGINDELLVTSKENL